MKNKLALLLLAGAMAACNGQHPLTSTGAETDAAALIVQNIALTSFPDREIKVAPLGDSLLCAKQLLQQAIDSCSLLGGGKVLVESGYYRLNGPLHLKSKLVPARKCLPAV